MRVLVTGPTGFIGRAFVPRLLERHEVTLLLLEEFGSGLPLPAPLDRLRPAYDVVYADLRHFGVTARAVREAAPQAVVHLASAGVTDPFLPVNTALSHNVTGTVNLLRAAFEGAVPANRLVVARTPGERTAMNVYAASKAAAWSFCEMYARTAAWPVNGAMIFQAYGPGQPPHLFVPSVVAAALAGQDFPMTHGEQRKDWVYLDDVVAGLLATLEADLPHGVTVELGSGQATSLREVAERVYALAGRGGRALIGALPGRPGEDPLQVADANATAALTGWRAVVTLEEGLRRMTTDH